jgi:hypothetical protein
LAAGGVEVQAAKTKAILKMGINLFIFIDFKGFTGYPEYNRPVMGGRVE